MSTFDGVIREYPLISIDRFLPPKNYASTVYFLSHCHIDHMYGLSGKSFHKHLVSRRFSKIYASDVSKHLLKNDAMYKHLEDYVVVLPIEQPTIIILYDENGQTHSKVVVTLLTAGHCPGSVMFLIEGNNGRVLYTGDFRLPLGSSARIGHLHDDNGRLKSLQSLYVDTTFCRNKYLSFPSREECLTEIISLVEPWIFQGPNYIVCFFCSAQYAYEFVFVELYKRYGVKTHVTADREKKYIGIKFIEEAVTSISSEARIHACAREKDDDTFARDFYESITPCGYFSPNQKPIQVLKIKPSAMFFDMKKLTDNDINNCSMKMKRVCYSTHPSLSEVRDMVKYLNPKVVYPNVVRGQTEAEILYLIYQFQTANSAESKSEDIFMSPLGQLKSPKVKELTVSGNDSLNFFDECYEIGKHSPIHNKPSHSRYEDPCIETDFENTEEQEAMLKEEVYFSQMEMAKCSVIDEKQPLHYDQSPLKWKYPIDSSDENVFDISSPLPNSHSKASDSDSLNHTMNEDIGDTHLIKSKCNVKSIIQQKSVAESLDCISGAKKDTEKEDSTENIAASHRSGKNLKDEFVTFQQNQNEVDFKCETQFSTIAKIADRSHCSKSFSLINAVNGSEQTFEKKQGSYQHIINLNESGNSYDSEKEFIFIRKSSEGDNDFKNQPVTLRSRSKDGSEFHQSLQEGNIFSEMNIKSYNTFQSILGSNSDHQNNSEIIVKNIEILKANSGNIAHASFVNSSANMGKSEVQKIEVVELSSDNSSGEIEFLGSSPVKVPFTSKSFIPVNCHLTRKHSSAEEESCVIEENCLTTSMNVITSPDHGCTFQRTIKNKNFGVTSDNITAVKKLHSSLEDLVSSTNSSDLNRGSSYVHLSKFTCHSDINMVPTACKNTLDETDPSDCDDSPSLIAPIFQVPKNKTSVDSQSICNSKSKKIKVDLKENGSVYKNGDCGRNFDKDDCDMDIVNYDSTPEDIIENRNLYANSNQTNSKVVEIFIDN